jgi:hypothetical protein
LARNGVTIGSFQWFIAPISPVGKLQTRDILWNWASKAVVEWIVGHR